MKNYADVRNWKLAEWTAVAVIIIILLIGGIYEVAKPAFLTTAKTVTITVKPGMSSDDIAQLLYENHVVASAKLFQITARMQGLENSLQAGEYVVTSDMSIPRILALMTHGQAAYCQFTIPEGYTINQIAQLLADKKIGSANKFKAAAQHYVPYDYMAMAPNEQYAAEGYAFPDTYRIGQDCPEEKILQMMVENFNGKLTAAMRRKAVEKGLSIRELVILASLVEKEAQLEKDRPIIAGVFLNRLKKNMPLQSCATIQYILGYAKPELTIQDTEIASPYNTYLHPGLPPGPIANPGLASLNAVLQPADTDYLYFVADRHGAHHFSKTYEEHLATIEKVRN